MDSELISAALARNGYEISVRESEANIILVNTCAFILPAKQESVMEILRLAQFKQKGRCRILIVTGCLPQRYGPGLKKELPEVDCFLGTNAPLNIARFVRQIEECASPSLSASMFNEMAKPGFLMNSTMPRNILTPGHYAYLKISEGCSNCCSYCVIPQIRGPLRSRSEQDILEEAQRLGRSGVKELIVIAQDTTSFGRDRHAGAGTLPRLLSALASLKDIHWIRLMYAYPARISRGLLKIMASEEKICNYIDMPIQHINDALLEKMNRKGNGGVIRCRVRLARDVVPDIALRTSVIVGFPGETRASFTELLEFVREAKFEHLGVFAFSPEDGTKAVRLSGKVTEKEKNRRKEIILDEQASISFEKNTSLIGSVREVIIDRKVHEADYPYQGRIRSQAPEIDGITHIKSNKQLKPGDISLCRITAADHYDLFALNLAE